MPNATSLAVLVMVWAAAASAAPPPAGATLWNHDPRDPEGGMHRDLEWVVASADGMTIATLSRSGVRQTMEVRLWDAATGAGKASWTAKDSPLGNRIALSRDGKWVAAHVWNDSREIVVWEAATGVERHRVATPKDVSDAEFGFTADGKRVLAAAPSWAVLLDLTTGKTETPASPKGRVRFAPDGRVLHHIDWDILNSEGLLLYDSVEDFLAGGPARPVLPPDREFRTVQIVGGRLPGGFAGTAVETAGGKTSSVAWSLPPGARRARVVTVAHDFSLVPALPRFAASPTGRFLSYCSSTSFVVDLADGKTIPLKIPGPPWTDPKNVFLPDGTLWVHRPGSLQPMDPWTGELDRKPAYGVRRTTEKPVAEPPPFKVADPTRPRAPSVVAQAFEQRCTVDRLAFSADGKTLVVGTRDSHNTISGKGRATLAVIDMAAGPRRKQWVPLSAEPPDVEGLAVNGTATLAAVLAGGKPPTVVLVDLAAGKVDKTVGPVSPDHTPKMISLSPDGKTVAVTDYGTAGIYDAANPAKPVRTVPDAQAPKAYLGGGRVLLGFGHLGEGTTLADGAGRPLGKLPDLAGWSADGSLFALLERNTVKIVDALGNVRRTITPVGELLGRDPITLSATRLFAREVKVVRAYDIATGRHVATYRLPDAIFGAVAVSPDGKMLVVSASGTLGFWNAAE